MPTTTDEINDENDSEIGVSKVELVPLQNESLITISSSLTKNTESTMNVLTARKLLYISHFFAQFSKIAFQFCLALFLSACTNYNSLILVSTYGAICGLAVFVTGGWIGRYLDIASNRLLIARKLIWGENLSVLCATVFCYILLTKTSSSSSSQENLDDDDDGDSSWLQRQFQSVPVERASILSLVAIHVFGAIAQVLDKGFLVAIERDWVVVICRSAANVLSENNGKAEANDEIESIFQSWLSQMNVTMKQIDLSCKVVAPAFASFLIPLVSHMNQTDDNADESPQTDDYRWACLLIGSANVASLIVEYICTARIYQLIPDLAVKENTSCINDEIEGNMEDMKDSQPNTKSMSEPRSSTCFSRFLPSGLRIYLEQSSACGGLALAFLYANALTFGNGILTAYLLYKGLRLELVGILRAIASAIGLLGTVAYRISIQRLSLETTGLWSITFELICLGLAFFSLFLLETNVALALLVTGVSLSRIGLWVFDIAITQMQQQEIPANVRGQVGGVQQSLNAGFNLLSFAIGVIFPNPRDFSYYSFTAFFSVDCAVLLFFFGIFLPRLKISRNEAERADQFDKLCSTKI